MRDPQPAPVCYAAYCGQNSPTATPTPAPSISAAPTTYCGEEWTEFENTCFRFFDTLANYDSVKAASAECANHGGYLATISSAAQNTVAASLVGGGIALIGLSDNATENDWVWADGSAVTYTNWASGQPGTDRRDENYAFLYYGDEWHDCGFYNSAGTRTVCSSDGFLCSFSAPTSMPTVTPVPSVVTFSPTRFTQSTSSICTSQGVTVMEGQEEGPEVYCFEIDGALYDIIPITSGETTCGKDDTNSCPEGTNIWVPRGYGHAKYVWDTFMSPNNDYMFAGIYRSDDGCGSCTSFSMNSDDMATYVAAADYNIGWTSVAFEPEPWFMRSNYWSEPNGDYDANCWLSIYGFDYDYNNGYGYGYYYYPNDDDSGEGGFQFNDFNCEYCYSSYLCSTNGGYAPAPTPAPSTAICTWAPSCALGVRRDGWRVLRVQRIVRRRARRPAAYGRLRRDDSECGCCEGASPARRRPCLRASRDRGSAISSTADSRARRRQRPRRARRRRRRRTRRRPRRSSDPTPTAARFAAVRHALAAAHAGAGRCRRRRRRIRRARCRFQRRHCGRRPLGRRP